MTLIWRLGALYLLTLGLMTGGAYAASEADAKAITAEYERAQKLWITEMKLAPSPAALEMVKNKRPDPSAYAKRLKRLLNRELDQAWSLKYGAWLLDNDAELSAGSQRALLDAVEKHHMLSPLVGRFAVAMVNLNEGGSAPPVGKEPVRSRGLKMLEKIKKVNPDQKVQGQAALALSLMYASLGDNPALMRQRITYLREAVMKSADVAINNRTVADIAKNQLYIIKNLSKGREAPNIIGNDSAGRAVQLSDYRGKVVMLVFWSSFDNELARVNQALEMVRNINGVNAGKPFVVLGVNRDTLKNLRALEADRIVTWRNISDPQQSIARDYRINHWPYCIVLDKKGMIGYSGVLGSFADAVVSDLLVRQ